MEQWVILVLCSVVVMEAGGRDLGVGAGRGEEGAGGGKKISSVTCPVPTKTRSKAVIPCSCNWATWLACQLLS